MDSKKNLKPELKDIYERVMNTNTAGQTSQPTAPAQSAAPAQPAPTTQPANTVTAPAAQAPKEPFLASSAPHPLNDSSTFVFSSHGGDKQPQEHKDEHTKEAVHEQKDDATPAKSPGKKTQSKLPIIITLMIVFLVIWTVFWVVALKLI